MSNQAVLKVKTYFLVKKVCLDIFEETNYLFKSIMKNSSYGVYLQLKESFKSYNAITYVHILADNNQKNSMFLL